MPQTTDSWGKAVTEKTKGRAKTLLKFKLAEAIKNYKGPDGPIR
jgi:hypothetical protein